MIAQFSKKTPSESVQVSFDFSSLLATPSDLITAVNWLITVQTGIDPNPNAMLSGLGAFTTNTASHLIVGGINTNSYLISCTATTSSGQILTLAGTMQISTAAATTKIASRQDLADYCLRQLGGGVVNIEVSNEQIDDAIDSAIQYYHEYHFDGIDRGYMVYKIAGTTMVVADGTIFNKGDNVASTDNKTAALIASVTGNILVTNKQIGFTKFAIGDTVKNTISGLTTTITGITLGDVDNGWIPIGDEVVSVKKILNISSVLGSSDYMFNVQYQIMMAEIQNLTSAGTAYYYGVQQYLGHLDFIMKKEKDFRFNRRRHQLYLDISWTTDVKVGSLVALELYTAIDPEQFPAVYSDIWLRRYATALIKRQWGSNLGKYQGLQLPGGVTYDGNRIYGEAVQDIQKLEDEAVFSSAPLEFLSG